jgi:protoporphyrinogen oxidase
MEYLSDRLASTARDLRPGHRVTAIDLDTRTVTAESREGADLFRYERLCSTLPLPAMLRLCHQTPETLRSAAAELTVNRVISVMFSIEGPRPRHRGHWRYYADPKLIFNRLIYMHEFDPQHAPVNGWGLMGEITEPSGEPALADEEIILRTHADVLNAGVIPPDCRIVDSNVVIADPAYVVFTRENRRIVGEARAFFRRYDVELLGRYGRWEYSSMAQVMRDGFEWAEEQTALRGAA